MEPFRDEFQTGMLPTATRRAQSKIHNPQSTIPPPSRQYPVRPQPLDFLLGVPQHAL